MNRLALTTLALALTAAGSASAYQDGYGNGNGYRDNNGSYDNGNSRYDNNRYPSGPRSDVAQVLRVERIGGRYGNQYGDQYGSNLRQECWNEQTNGYENGYYRDSNGRLYRGDGRSNNSGGTLLGALIGGALGNQVGKGDGRTAATIGGAVIGGAIGNHVARENDNYDQYRDNSGVVRRCRTVSDNNGYDNGSRGGSGYNVTYRYGGQTYHAVTNYNPGNTMRVVVDVRPQDGNVAYSR
jgi:uncharacterized protein YcfJ